jgi:hypothetical protein
MSPTSALISDLIDPRRRLHSVYCFFKISSFPLWEVDSGHCHQIPAVFFYSVGERWFHRWLQKTYFRCCCRWMQKFRSTSSCTATTTATISSRHTTYIPQEVLLQIALIAAHRHHRTLRTVVPEKIDPSLQVQQRFGPYIKWGILETSKTKMAQTASLR